jgi:subfamily B ATP-binding cassette protein MsbA
MLQETFLVDGTIRENVAFSRPDATEAQILEACRVTPRTTSEKKPD